LPKQNLQVFLDLSTASFVATVATFNGTDLAQGLFAPMISYLFLCELPHDVAADVRRNHLA
jgi:hypothetical protein